MVSESRDSGTIKPPSRDPKQVAFSTAEDDGNNFINNKYKPQYGSKKKESGKGEKIGLGFLTDADALMKGMQLPDIGSESQTSSQLK